MSSSHCKCSTALYYAHTAMWVRTAPSIKHSFFVKPDYTWTSSQNHQCWNVLHKLFRSDTSTWEHAYLFKCLQQVAAGHRQCDVYMMHDEQRLLLRLIGEVGQIISDEQQHVHLNLLLRHRETNRWKRSVSTSQQRASVRKRKTHKER